MKSALNKNLKASKNFLKTSLSVDTKKKVILGWNISQKPDYKIKHEKSSDQTIK